MAKKTKKSTQIDLPMSDFIDASLAEELKRRYLNYALSVITSRALPDVRDGLKPVQRRILYTMWNELRLRHDVKHRKSAAIVGDVMGKFHPHGDTAIYDALVRMAQSFTLRAPLVDGRGNFGSPDDPPAAMRYTEARLQKLSQELLSELGQQTVAFRPNYDGTRFEPVVLPSRFPNLLANGSQGIAVGMATSIPPHNLGELIKTCIKMIDDPKLSLRKAMRILKGPDFPTGGELIADKELLYKMYKTGQGSMKLRGTWSIEAMKGKGARTHSMLVITEVPYSVSRSVVVEKIAEQIEKKKLPALVDVRDESTDVCRIVCEYKKDADAQKLMAFLFKHTPMQTNVSANLTCLVPTDSPDIAAPQRCDLLTMLRHFLDFRMEVVTKRLEFDLKKLEERIHILEGLQKIFDALDETIRIIRKSNDKKDAAQKLRKRFKLSELQVDAILELRLHRLAKLQILLIEEELGEKLTAAKKLKALLKSKPARWKLIRTELAEVEAAYATPRRTKIVGELTEPAFDAEDFIIDEDAMVVLSEAGWLKRQQRVKDVNSTRVRDGDRVIEVVAGSTKSSVALFSSAGICYVTRLVDIPQTSGYGSPVQSLFKLADGERIVAMMGFDPRFLEVPPPNPKAKSPEEPHALGVTRGGMTMRFSLRNHRDPSNRNGRKFCRLKKNDEVIYVAWVEPGECIACVSKNRRALICEVDDVSVLGGAGQGVKLIRLEKGDHLVGAKALIDDQDRLVAKRKGGSDYVISTRKYNVVSRGGKGFQLFTRGAISEVEPQEPTLPGFPAPEEEE